MPPTDGDSSWRFPQGTVMIRANGREQLVDRVFEFRLRNNIEIGDIQREVDAYYCGLYPRFCHAEPHDTNPNAPRTSQEPMLNRVSRWAAGVARKMPRGGHALATTSEAEQRAVICSQCPKQDAAWKGGCGGCAAATLQLVQQIKSLRQTKHDGNLGACEVGGWQNGAAVWLPSEALLVTEEQMGQLPVACWRKKIS